MRNYKFVKELFAGYNMTQGTYATIEVFISKDMTFTLSSNTYQVEIWDDERKRDYTEEYIDGCSSDVLLDWLKDYDCSYSELTDYIMDDIQLNGNFYDHPYRLCDVLEDEDGNEYVAEDVSGGQHDIREDDLTITSQAIIELLEIWDNHHLKTIDNDLYYKVLDLVNNVEYDTDRQDVTFEAKFYVYCKEVLEVEGLR